MENEASKIERVNVTALDEMLGVPFKVLDDGFIRVVDYMGSDESIVQAARVSYGQGTKKVSEDRGLIRYLMRHSHTTPFEMCEIKLHVRVPMDCWRQWIRHRTANVNEYSTRYSLAIESCQKTAPDKWRVQSNNNKQGSEGFLDITTGSMLSDEEQYLHGDILEAYKKRIEFGVAREQARKDLPLSTYTEAYWKIDLHNLFHFLRLRMDAHAQFEIRSYAQTIGSEIVKRWCPLAWEAFEDYVLNTTAFNKNELSILNLIIQKKDKEEIMTELKRIGFLTGEENKHTREFKEFEQKISALNLKI